MVWGIFKKDSVSEAYKKMKGCATEELKGDQEKIDVNKNGKIDGEDLAKLRASKKVAEDYDDETAITPADAKKAKKPEVEEDYDDETAITPADAKKKKTVKEESEYDFHRRQAEHHAKLGNKKREEYHREKMKDAEDFERYQSRFESAEDLVEYESKDGVYKHAAKPGRYGGSEKESDYVKGPSDKELNKIENEKKKKKNEGFDIFNEKELDMLINEVLSKNASAGEWISDFIKSDNPKFAGKSKEQRKKMALGAYYAAQRNESTDYESFVVLDEEKQGDVVKMDAKEIKHANMKDKQDDQEIMEPHSGTEQKFIDAHTIRVTDDPTRVKQDAGKVTRASEPKGKGPGSYDAKEKLGNQKTGIKEAIVKTDAGEEIDTTPGEKKDTSGKVKGKKIAGDDNDHS